MWAEPGLSTLVGGQRVGDVAGERELLDPRRDRRVRRRLEVDLLVGVHRRRPASSSVGWSSLGLRPGLAAPLPQLALARAPASRRPGRPSRGRCRRPRPRRVRIGWVSVALVRLLGRGAAEQPVAQRAEPGRHLVDRRRGDDQERRTARAAPAPAPRRTPSAAGPAAGWRPRSRSRRRRTGGRWRRRAAGCGLPLAMWTMPSTPKPSASQPITCRPAGPLCSGSRMLRQPMRTSSTGTSQPTLPTEPDDDGAVDVHDPAGQLPPDGGGDDDGQADQEQPDAVAAVLGLEVAGGAADPAGAGADAVGGGHPGRADAAAERAEGARDRAAAAADGTRCGTARRRVLLDRVLRDREVELLLRLGLRLRLRGRGPGRGRALAPRPRRGRRTGRHGVKARPAVTPVTGIHTMRVATHGKRSPTIAACSSTAAASGGPRRCERDPQHERRCRSPARTPR